MTRGQELQQKFWHTVYPVVPFFERLARPFRLSRRQNYLLGWLHPERTLDELQEHLRTKWLFEQTPVAWVDDGQVLSLRRRISFQHQYHVRVFEDAEIRGHFEYAPEAHPLKHLMHVGLEMRMKDLQEFLDGYLILTPSPRRIDA